MIVHSTRNQLDNTCVVQVEGIPVGYPEALVVLFATGAAATHNAGYDVASGRVTEWLEDDGLPIDAACDTAFASGARVTCALEDPA
jgi:hypothetical protein